MKKHIHALFLFLPLIISAQNLVLSNDSSSCDQYPEIRRCSDLSSLKSAKKCFSEEIQKKLNKKINYNFVGKVVNQTLRDTLSTTQWKQLKGNEITIKNKIRVVLGANKKWNVKEIDTEYPRLVPYFEKLLIKLPKIKKPAICSGTPVDVKFNLPLYIQVPIY